MKKLLFITACIQILLLTACHDFLSQYPKDQVYPTSTSDFNELLVGDGYMDAIKVRISVHGYKSWMMMFYS